MLKKVKIEDVVVTTDSDEIIKYCNKFSVKIRKRPDHQAKMILRSCHL